MTATPAPDRVIRRTAVALVALILVGLMPQAVVAGPSRGVAATAMAAGAPPRKAENRSPHVRGRVDLRNVDKGRVGPTEQGPQDLPIEDDRRLATAQDITAAPPTAFATPNSTTTPTLTKLGALPGGDSLYADAAPTVSVGPDHVVRSDQEWFRVSNRTGGSSQLYAFEALLQQPDAFDPQEGYMWYVPSIGRWLAVSTSIGYFFAAGNQLCNLGTLDFAVSDTANPNAGWAVYYYEYRNATVSDPGFGTSSDKFAFTVTVSGEADPPAVCGDGAPDGVDLTINEWSDVIGHDSFTSGGYFFPDNGTSGTDFLIPSIGNSPNTPNLAVLAHTFESSGAVQGDRLYEVSGPVPGLAISWTDLTSDELIPLIGDPLPVGPPREQATRAASAVLHDERLVSVVTEACTPTGDSAPRNCVRLIDIDIAGGGPAVLQDFYLASLGKDTLGPGLAFSDTGELVVTYQRASAGTGASAYVVRQAPTDAPNTVSAPRLLEATGGSSVSARSVRFVGASPDPLVPDAVWVTNNVGTSSSDPYLTQTAQVRTAAGDTFFPLEPLRLLDTRDGTGLAGVFQNNVPRTFNVAGAFGGEIPDDAVAITGNLTVAGQTSAGYVSVGPSISANPTSSTINFPFGDNRANNLTLPLNTNGDLMAVFKGNPTKSTHLILDVTGYFLADDTGDTYKPITAARVLDSRFGTGLSGAFTPNNPQSFQVTGVGGASGVPAGATAVTGNLTVVNASRAGYVTLAPEPNATPETSTINFPLGDTRANGVTVPLAENGMLAAVFKASGGSTDLIFDVTGYYLDGLSGLRFYPLNPGRIMDTRFNTLTQLFGQFSNSVARTLVTGGHFGVPANALAVTGNLTVVGQTKGGYVSITKNPVATPPVSTINFPFGDIRANGVTVPLNAANDMALVYKSSSGAKTHLILDVTGYFR